ncbi:MAG TPA: glycosyltransferase family 2 protein [Candidatus Andersenbacteria bacterium]|nr:MAG: hypothetical protein A2854_02015 [Parcubacteria group bacterium RIFCSPHIGHO2_01_FULL_56_18]HLD25650.1 glycosyltransferase family 2 protein [Candidatus Andersenbacteria bacterium]
MTLSAIIIAKNAADTIERAVRSVKWANETIVIVDAATRDATAARAEQLGAKVYVRPWPGYGAQKNFGRDVAHGEWLLFIDDDEEVTPALAQEIQKVTHYSYSASWRTTHSLYWLRIVTVFLGRPLTHLYGHNPRLFKKAAAQWTAAAVHEQVVRNTPLLTTHYSRRPIKLDDSDTGLITEPLLHHSHPTIASYLAKMHRYTTLDAQQMAATHTHRTGRAVMPAWHLPCRLAARQLLKLLIYRRGILDGWQGIVWCIMSSYYEWEMAQKYRQLCA